MKTTATRTLTCSPSELTVQSLIDFFGDTDGSSSVRITITPGDRPFDPAMATITVTEVTS